VREANWKYTELPVTPGEPDSEFEIELYDLQNDPLELNSLHNDLAQAMRIINMKARLRALRGMQWPDDSDPAAEEPDDDE
jgi:hypothetical protein